mmetsp:Transcript_4732/g.8087  ORF Transcript_4732/g.8087 Transcript_4732/m.8087 type:complete len:115 (+) Transcript_4732:1113-1457(+)
MRTDVYHNLIALASDADNEQALQTISSVVSQGNQKDLCLTIKNYGFEKGLSRFVHEDILSRQQVFQINGPLGRGLNISQSGLHVAFTGGTGILVFIDIVAQIILKLQAGSKIPF